MDESAAAARETTPLQQEAVAALRLAGFPKQIGTGLALIPADRTGAASFLDGPDAAATLDLSETYRIFRTKRCGMRGATTDPSIDFLSLAHARPSLAQHAGETVIDVGCGTGSFAEFVRAAGFDKVREAGRIDTVTDTIASTAADRVRRQDDG